LRYYGNRWITPVLLAIADIPGDARTVLDAGATRLAPSATRTVLDGLG
jgi:hypothetical protein